MIDALGALYLHDHGDLEGLRAGSLRCSSVPRVPRGTGRRRTRPGWRSRLPTAWASWSGPAVCSPG